MNDQNVYIFFHQYSRRRHTKNGTELIIFPRKYKITNSVFTVESGFKALNSFKFLMGDSNDRIKKLTQEIIPRFVERCPRTITNTQQTDNISVFSFATADNSMISTPCLERRPLCDLNYTVFTVTDNESVVKRMILPVK